MNARVLLSLAVVSAIGAGCVRARLETSSAMAAESTLCQATVDADRHPAPEMARWFRPDDPDDRAHLNSWCEAVGPAVFAPARDAGVAGLRALTVVSWNAHVGGGDLLGLVRALREGRVPGVAPAQDLVILLQEAYRAGDAVPAQLSAQASSASAIRETPASGPRMDIVEAARVLGLSLYYAPSMRNGAPSPGRAGEDRGNAILSSLPLTDLRAIELPFERQRRVAVAATIKGVDATGAVWHLRAVSAHLDNLAPRSLWIFASGARERQARGLVGALPADAFSVIGSDLNTWAGGTREPAYLALQRSFPQTPPPAYRSSGEGGLLLDYMFWRSALGEPITVRRLDDTYGSDHYPLVTHIEMGQWGNGAMRQ